MATLMLLHLTPMPDTQSLVSWEPILTTADIGPPTESNTVVMGYRNPSLLLDFRIRVVALI